MLTKILETLTYIISPPYCASCRKEIQERNIFCETCFSKIKPITTIKLEINKNYKVTVIAIADYKEPIKALILAKKSSNFLASKQLGQLMWQMTNLKNFDFDYIVPIPLHYTRQIRRGYNQTETIALELSKYSNKPVEKILHRTKITKYQLELTKDERSDNLKGAFTVSTKYKDKFENKHILLIDDLFTTGATLTNACKELIKLKPAAITAVVACRVV